MSRNKLGHIPDSHFENEPGPIPKKEPQLSQALLDHIAAVKKTEPGDGDGELNTLRGDDD